MIYILGGLVFLACVWLMARAFLTADPKKLAIGVKWGGGLGLATLAGFLFFRGNLAGMGTALGAILPLLIRWGRLRQILFPTRTSTGPTSTGGSSLDTAFLKVALDHATGRMTGEVIAGRHQGRRLEDLTSTEAVNLLDEARADPATVQVLEAFLDREHPGWREAGGTSPPSSPPSGSMSRTEALQILDLAEDASAGQVREAHRRLMMANHPDRGGSTYLAAQINRAKDVLLGEG
jgi:hypothetical protein